MAELVSTGSPMCVVLMALPDRLAFFRASRLPDTDTAPAVIGGLGGEVVLVLAASGDRVRDVALAGLALVPGSALVTGLVSDTGGESSWGCTMGGG